jgi:PleD family two-component response regulator
MSNGPVNEMREIQKLLNQLVGMVCSMPAELQNAMREQLETSPIITDYLTGAYSRLFFYEVLRRQTGRADRHDMPLSLLIADIDSFKFVNDTLFRREFFRASQSQWALSNGNRIPPREPGACLLAAPSR